MVTLISYFIAVNLIGLSLVLYLNMKSKIEIVSLSFPLGALIISLYMWGLSLINLTYSKEVIFIPLIATSIGLIILRCILRREQLFKLILGFKNSANKFKLRISVSNIFYIFLLSAITIQVMFILFHSMASTIYQPDEFSYWGLQPKLIFLGDKVNTFYGETGFETGFDSYPNFIPLLVASIYYYFGIVVDSLSRFIGPVFLLCLLLFLYDFLKGLIQSKIIILLTLNIFVYSGQVIFEMSSGLYADIPYAFFYTVSIVYLYKYFYKDSSNKNIILSAIFMGATAWTKIDGLYMIFIHIPIILLFMIKEIKGKLKANFVNIILYSAISLSLPLLWNIYTIRLEFPSTKWVITPHFEFLVDMITSSVSQMFNFKNWGLFWYIALFYLVIGIYKKISWNQLFILSIVLSNFAFLYISYLLVFTWEAATAASFARYILRIAPLSLILIITFISDVTDNNGQLKGGDI